MTVFGSLPKCLAKIFSRVSHFACNSPLAIRPDCRTEAKNTANDAPKGHPNVTMRLVRESR